MSFLGRNFVFDTLSTLKTNKSIAVAKKADRTA